MAPIALLPQRVCLYDSLDLDRHSEELVLLAKRSKLALAEIEKLGLDIQVMRVLSAWQSPSNGSLVDGLARGYFAGKQKISEQLKMRRSLLYFMGRIEKPSMPPRLVERIMADCNSAMDRLQLELECYHRVLGILAKHGAKLTPRSKPRDTSLTKTVKDLHRLLTPTYPSRNSRAKIIHRLLKLVDPEYAPVSPDSIRTGYR
jgi:hypothetical protein